MLRLLCQQIPPDHLTTSIPNLHLPSLYLLKDKPTFSDNLAGVAHYTVAGKEALAPGAHTIVYNFKYDDGLGKGGEATNKVDGTTVATGRIERTRRSASRSTKRWTAARIPARSTTRTTTRRSSSPAS
ncbi:MAG: hypothetical protein NT013_06345 [Planctomycetia bacterium]|nr:hypothetical protein [Planctomycetia bacterium]